MDRAAHTRCMACRLGVADGGAAIRSSALKKLEGDATVDGAQRAKVSVRPAYHVDSSKRATDGRLALVSMCCHKGWHSESIEWPGWAVHALCTAGHAGVRVTIEADLKTVVDVTGGGRAEQGQRDVPQGQERAGRVLQGLVRGGALRPHRPGAPGLRPARRCAAQQILAANLSSSMDAWSWLSGSPRMETGYIRELAHSNCAGSASALLLHLAYISFCPSEVSARAPQWRGFGVSADAERRCVTCV